MLISLATIFTTMRPHAAGNLAGAELTLDWHAHGDLTLARLAGFTRHQGMASHCQSRVKV